MTDTKPVYLMNETESDEFFKTGPYTYVISDPLAPDDAEWEWEFSSKEDFFNKMIELNHLDKYGVVHFKMVQSVFGPVHRYDHSVKKYDQSGNWTKRVIYARGTACHKDGLHEKFLTEY